MGANGAHSSEALQAHDLRGLFVLLGLGLSVGLLLALLELLSRARSQAKDGKVGKSITQCDFDGLLWRHQQADIYGFY